ncbi:MAG: patatin-like phospholipase family protein [Myxococcales bacterium]|nr:patatin-like phospholipase family protein [Myxococcales bacterium]
MGEPYVVTARATLTGDGLSVARFTEQAAATGVGVAFSGGGTRAAVTAMGVLRALEHLGYLPQIRAISAVSGGAWFSVPFTYLPPSHDERVFLGTHLSDPGALRWRRGDAPEAIDSVTPGSFLEAASCFELGARGLLKGMQEDRLAGVPSDRVWTRRVSEALLRRYGLCEYDDAHAAADFFAADAQAAAAIQRESPALAGRTCHVVRTSDAMPRPFLIVNGALRVRAEGGEEVLAPVQFTPSFSGVMGAGIGTLDGREVGGGGVSSYAFDGEWIAGAPGAMQIRQRAPMSLCDILGVTSVYYADLLGDHDFHLLSPTYTYASPLWTPPAGARGVYVDGGSVESTGVANLLSYGDIDRVIAVVSSPAALERRGDDIVVERQVGSLFGIREWNQKHGGYARYDAPGEGNPDYAHNQVFAADDGEFLALTRAMGAREAAGEPIVVEQTLRVVDNPKYAVTGGRRVRVLWLLLSPAARWRAALHPAVSLRIPPSFPNIPTAITRPPRGHVHALAQFAGWAMEQRADALARLFAAG